MYEHVWKPFIETFIDKESFDYTNIYTEENLLVDYEIYYKNGYRKILFDEIESSVGFNFLDLIYKSDMDGIKNNIINVQYSEKNIENKNNNYITYEETMKTNNKIIEYAKKEFIEKMI
jgi:hypothetical protein